MIRKILFLSVFYFLISNGYSQKIASFEVELSKATYGPDISISVNLDYATYVSYSVFNLLEIKRAKKSVVLFQIEQGDPR